MGSDPVIMVASSAHSYDLIHQLQNCWHRYYLMMKLKWEVAQWCW